MPAVMKSAKTAVPPVQLVLLTTLGSFTIAQQLRQLLTVLSTNKNKKTTTVHEFDVCIITLASKGFLKQHALV